MKISTKREQKYNTPKNIEETIFLLDKTISEEDKAMIKTLSEDGFLAKSHFGLGTYTNQCHQR